MGNITSNCCAPPDRSTSKSDPNSIYLSMKKAIDNNTSSPRSSTTDSISFTTTTSTSSKSPRELKLLHVFQSYNTSKQDDDILLFHDIIRMAHAFDSTTPFDIDISLLEILDLDRDRDGDDTDIAIHSKDFIIKLLPSCSSCSSKSFSRMIESMLASVKSTENNVNAVHQTLLYIEAFDAFDASETGVLSLNEFCHFIQLSFPQLLNEEQASMQYERIRSESPSTNGIDLCLFVKFCNTLIESK